MSDLDTEWERLKAKPTPARSKLDLDWDAAALKSKREPPQPTTSAGDAAVMGAGQGLTLGSSDEIYGAAAADFDTSERLSKTAEQTKKAKAEGHYGVDAPDIPQIISTQLKVAGTPTRPAKTISDFRVGKSPHDDEQQPTWVDDYRRNRDQARAMHKKAEADQPVAYNGAEFGGSMLVPVPGVGKTKGIARLFGHALQGGTIGGLAAAGHSESDLTKGEFPEFLAESGKGAAIGAPLGAAGGKFADWIAGKGDVAREGARAAAQRLAEKTFASKRGGLGGEVSAASRSLDVLEKAAADDSLPEEIRRAASDFLAGPEAAKLKQQVVRSNLGRGEDQLARIAKAREAMTDAAGGLAPEAVEKDAASRLSWGNAANSVGGRLKRLAFGRLTPMLLGAGIGGHAYGGSGALGGAVAGSLLASLGNPSVAEKTSNLVAPVVGGLTRGAEAIGGAAMSKNKDDDSVRRYLDLLKDDNK